MKRTHAYYEKRAAEILQAICYATLATVDAHGRPWNSPVSAVYDDDLSVYWFSDRQGQHSKNVRQTGQVFIVIYDSTWPEGAGRQGVYFQARAYEVNDPAEISHARKIKKGEASSSPAPFMDNAVRRVYKAVPERAWMNETQIENGKFIRDYRVELSLRGVSRQLVRLRKEII